MKTIIKSLLLLSITLLPVLSASAQPAIYVEGTHFTTLDSPVRTSDPNKIEVVEIFWYGCPHCYAFEPLIENWEQDLNSDVAFVRSPGMWNALMEIHAQVYYAAEALDVVESIHPAAFDSINQKGIYLQTEDEIRELFVQNGVEADAFNSTWASFGVSSSVKRANTRMRDYGIRGVPSMVVNGKYRVTVGDGVSSQVELLKIVDYLVEMERGS